VRWLRSMTKRPTVTTRLPSPHSIQRTGFVRFRTAQFMVGRPSKKIMHVISSVGMPTTVETTMGSKGRLSDMQIAYLSQSGVNEKCDVLQIESRAICSRNRSHSHQLNVAFGSPAIAIH
jgi:hypothetical protein